MVELNLKKAVGTAKYSNHAKTERIIEKGRFAQPVNGLCGSTPFAFGRGRDAGRPTPPSQIPACSFPAPGSSRQLACARYQVGRKSMYRASNCPSFHPQQQGIASCFRSFSTIRGAGTLNRFSSRLNARHV